MTWKRYDDSGTRWSWTADEERHLLLLSTTQARELHEVPGGAVTVHVYEPDDLYDGKSEAFADLSAVVVPLAEMTHVATYEVPANFAPWVRALDDREVFEYLADAGYAK